MKKILHLTVLCAVVIHFTSLQVFAAAMMKDRISATYDITESTQIDNYFAANTNPADFYVGNDNGRQFVVNEGINGSLYYQNGGESVLSLAQLSSYLGRNFYSVNNDAYPDYNIMSISGVTKGEGLASIGLKSNYDGMTVLLYDGITNVGANSFSYSNFSSWEDEETGFYYWTYKFRESDLIEAANGLNPNILGPSTDWAFLVDFGTGTYLDSLDIMYEDLYSIHQVTLNYNADSNSNVTPEPASLLIVGLALGALPLIRRQRKK